MLLLDSQLRHLGTRCIRVLRKPLIPRPLGRALGLRSRIGGGSDRCIDALVRQRQLLHEALLPLWRRRRRRRPAVGLCSGARRTCSGLQRRLPHPFGRRLLYRRHLQLRLQRGFLAERRLL